MDLLMIPKVVFEEALLPKLGWNDLLRLRRVCTATKDTVDHFLNLEENSDLAPEIEIDEDKKNFGAFLKMGISTSRIFLNNVSGPAFYEAAGKNVIEFIKQYGSKLKHLRVRQLSYFLHGKEWTLLSSLTNLQTFEARHFGGWDEKKSLTALEIVKVIDENRILFRRDRPTTDEPSQFRDLFKQVRSLRIGNNENFEFGNLVNILGYTERFLDSPSLEYALLPFSAKMVDVSGAVADTLSRVKMLPMTLAFFMITRSIRQLGLMNPDGSQLKVFDFLNYHADDLEVQLNEGIGGSMTFLYLCEDCVGKNVKLMNVAAFWFIERGKLSSQLPLGEPILSLVNLHPCVTSLDMPNLEKIEIRDISTSSPGPNWRNDRREWPALKSLDINLESKFCGYYDIVWERTLAPCCMPGMDLLQFFFHDIFRPNMIDLRLNFKAEKGNVVIPKVVDIVSACPNLKKLTLINWPGTNKALAEVFEGLTGLEEISLENCKNLGNVAFIGADVDKPIFLKLKNLKRLSLKGLDMMPKITNTLFSLVIRHLKLSHFTLMSDSPLKMVTSDGIRSLLNGVFAEFIEKFPFDGWSLDGVSSEEFMQLGSEFRSSHML